VARPGDPDQGAAGRRRGEAGPGRHPAGRGGLGRPGLLGGPPGQAARDAPGRTRPGPGPADRRRPGRRDPAHSGRRCPALLEGRRGPRGLPPPAGPRHSRRGGADVVGGSSRPAFRHSWLASADPSARTDRRARSGWSAKRPTTTSTRFSTRRTSTRPGKGRWSTAALSGVASDGRDLTGLLYQPVVTALTGIQRGAASIDLWRRAGAPGHDRAHAGRRRRPRRRPGGDDRPAGRTGLRAMLVGTVVLAVRHPRRPKFYRWNDGFERHPAVRLCPRARREDTADDVRTDPKALLRQPEPGRAGPPSSRRPAPRRSGAARTCPRSSTRGPAWAPAGWPRRAD
jgi:hypothetical protein